MQGFLALFLFISISSFAQEKKGVNGNVSDSKNQALSNVSVQILELHQSTYTDESGRFTFELPDFPPQELTLKISLVGKQTIEKIYKLSELGVNLNFKMEDLNLSLTEVKVNAVRTYKGNSNSSIIINRENILQTPSLSLADILNELPGQKIQASSLQSPLQLTLRGNASGDHAFANANGIALIVDGNRLNNDANMQFNGLSGTGLKGALINGNYGLGGQNGSKPDNVFGGFDLRQIPVENIESIEVISGVASARYGDITDGAVIVNRQAGETPFYLRSQFRNGTTQFSLDKGLKISRKTALNTGLSLTNSNDDPRDKIKSYRRLDLRLMLTNRFGNDQRIKNTFSIDLGKNLDGVKADSDDRDSSQLKSINNSYRFSNRLNVVTKSSFVKQITFNASVNFSKQETYKGLLVNNAPFAYISSTEQGFFEGTYTNGNYYFENLIKGKPININGNLDFRSVYNLGKQSHTLSYGFNYSYFKNNGEGRIVNPARPLTPTGYTSVYRDYDFNRIIGQQNVGAYIEDTFEQQFLKRRLNWSVGFRGDNQNGFYSFSPRISNNYKFAKNWNLGLAFGYGYRSPSLALRFPGPSFQDFTLVNYYPNIPAENLYLAYTDVFYPDNSKVKPSRSISYEFNLSNTLKNVNWSLSAYHKINRDGFTTQSNDRQVILPQYQITRNVGEKPTLVQTGTKQSYWSATSAFNGLTSYNNGVELWLTTSKIEAIQTSFNISSSFSSSKFFTEGLSRESIPGWLEQAPNNNYAVIAYYVRGKSQNLQGSSRITANTHIQPLSLLVRFTAEAFWYNRTTSDNASNFPSAYITKGGEYVTINNFEDDNQNYKHIIKNRDVVKGLNTQPQSFFNFHLSVSKEIMKKMRFSFNAYNVFNYQPSYYLQNSNTLITFNSAPSFGAEISFKF